MAYEEILYDVSDRVATVTLSRPDKLNAWTARMADEVKAAMDAAAADDGVRVIVLTGVGRGFCAGADMSLLSAAANEGVRPTVAPKEERAENFAGKHSYFASIPKPVIAAVNGVAAGLGFILPLYADIRLASDAARFSTVFSKRGLIAEYGIAWMLPRLVGMGNALDLLYTSRMIDAAEALRIGLVQRVIAADAFADGVREYALDLASNVSPRSLRVMKQQAYAGLFETHAQAEARADAEMLPAFENQDFKEGVAHFLETRAAVFSGR